MSNTSSLITLAEQLLEKYSQMPSQQGQQQYLSDDDKSKLFSLLSWTNGIIGRIASAFGGNLANNQIPVLSEMHQKLASSTPSVTVTEAKQIATQMLSAFENVRQVQQAAQSIINMK